MLEKLANAVTFYAFYTESKVGKTGLTVTVDVWEHTKTGTATEIVTAGSAVEIGDGLYKYVLSSGSVDAAGEYLAVFKTATTSVDQQHVPALWVVGRAGVENLDAAVSSRSTLTAAGAWDHLLSAISTVGSVGKLVKDYLDASVGSRLPTTSYTAPDNAGITAILADTGTDLPAQIDGLNNLSQAQAQTAAEAALSAYDPPTEAEMNARTLASGSYATASAVSSLAARFSGITSLAAWLRLLARKDAGDATAKGELNTGGGSYDESTDSLEGAVDSGSSGATPQQLWSYPVRTVTQSAAQVESAVSGEALTGLRGDLLVFVLTGIGSLVDRSKLWVTVKSDPERDTDAQAVVQIEETAGLLRLNGEAYATATDGSIEVTDEAEGDLTITLKAAASRLLPVRPGMAYDIQILVDGQPVTRVSGVFNVTADVTRTVS